MKSNLWVISSIFASDLCLGGDKSQILRHCEDMSSTSSFTNTRCQQLLLSLYRYNHQGNPSTMAINLDQTDTSIVKDEAKQHLQCEYQYSLQPHQVSNYALLVVDIARIVESTNANNLLTDIHVKLVSIRFILLGLLNRCLAEVLPFISLNNHFK